MRNPLNRAKKQLAPGRGAPVGRKRGARDPLARVKGLARSAGSAKGRRGPLGRTKRGALPTGKRSRSPMGWLNSLTSTRRP